MEIHNYIANSKMPTAYNHCFTVYSYCRLYDGSGRTHVLMNKQGLML